MTKPKRYTCFQCIGRNYQPLKTDDLLCPGCWNFLTNDPEVIDAYFIEHGLIPALPASGRVGTTVCVAHWGDSMVALAYTKHVLDALKQPCCDALHYGKDTSFVEFLHAQPWIGKVYHRKPGANYDLFVQNALNRKADASAWVHLLREDFPEVPPAAEIFTDGIANYHTVRQRRVLPIRFELPHSRWLWAACYLRRTMQERGLTDPPVFLHPSSTWSEGQEGHWKHWPAAIDWLLSETPHTYLATGVNALDWLPTHPRLVNALGVCPTNMDNLALAEMCAQNSPHGCVTTCNSVAMWSASQGFPSLILGNRALLNGFVNPFRRYFDRAPNRFLPVEASFEAFVTTAKEYFAQ